MIKQLFLLYLLLNASLVFAKTKINFKGEIILDDLEYKAKFELIEKKDLRVLRVSVASSICDFRIKRISSPQQTRGYDGVVFANKTKNCNHKSLSEKEFKFWSNIELIDINYRFINSDSISGEARLNSLNESYNASLKFNP